MSWELLWKVVLVTLIVALALMSVLVTIRGAADIRNLMAELKESETDASDTPCDSPPAKE